MPVLYMCLALAVALALALVSVVSYNRKWCCNLEHQLTDDISIIIYDCIIFMIQAIGWKSPHKGLSKENLCKGCHAIFDSGMLLSKRTSLQAFWEHFSLN
jgi:hypothetical protein